ncbi:uncharacterized protein LOC129315320 isoform X3 [Prosopis cineraria]|uniref:uncharacterized protein LOC129315320 isoform X3 n=1 Tax=Prosopis cineraria TaxID=364024 RepID=UPI00240F47EF|nr:uncharacterized protein LOC129315320 isoform X3 [Prosopis cineraria]
MSQAENDVNADDSLKYNVEFKSHDDDAWYSVRAVLEREDVLRIKFQNFGDSHDKVFQAQCFNSLEEVEEFKKRFRPVSLQLQDDECRTVIPGTTVCACYRYCNEDVRFYDATVFVVVSGQEGIHPSKKCGFLERLYKETRCARRSVSKTSSSCASLYMSFTAFLVIYLSSIQDRIAKLLSNRKEDRDLGGKKSMFMILVGNLDKALSPTTIGEFLYGHTFVSPKVFAFPSLSSELFTRGAFIVDSEGDFKRVRNFLSDPTQIIVSSTGRPWVIIEEVVGL